MDEIRKTKGQVWKMLNIDIVGRLGTLSDVCHILRRRFPRIMATLRILKRREMPRQIKMEGNIYVFYCVSGFLRGSKELHGAALGLDQC